MEHTKFDPNRIRADFPILHREVGGRPLIYLDNAATAQKPKEVIDAINQYYAYENANIHRGVHYLSEQLTEDYEQVRAHVAKFLGSEDPAEVVFTRGATESINLVAEGFAKSILKDGDEILITQMEHHANIVPWQMAAEQTGAKLKILPVLPDGSLDMEALPDFLTERTRILAFVHTSNTLGTINPAKEMIAMAHAKNIPVLLDGAQLVPHAPVDLIDLDCDFFVFSGHKLFGPTGIGVLWGKREWLERLPPYQGGGDMIEVVDFEGTTFKEPPGKFEAGTPHIAGVIGLGAAIDYLETMDRAGALVHEQNLLEAATAALEAVPDLSIFGTATQKASVLSFLIEGMHPHDIGTFLNADGIAIRTGHHCTQPLLKAFGHAATARASFAFYNTIEEVEHLGIALHKMRRFFG
ncbi:MAG: Cysteine desulfurase [Opitutia bacterium UBA7350]|nr:MAG: Cysteine desulfurase [Opitutae bacterium UBA7350]